MLEISHLKEYLAEPKRIVITTHPKPDGDAMGSSLGLYNYLIQKGHQIQVITPTDYPKFLHWLPNNSEVIVFTEEEEKAKRFVDQADIIFCLDFNSLSRIYEIGDLVRESKAKKVLIDHHLEPEGFEDFRLWNTGACATAHLVYEFIVDIMDDRKLLNKDVASCLYTGIMTDTGSFRFRSTTERVHQIVADLIAAGADNTLIHQLVYDDFSLSRLRFLGHCLLNKLEVLPEFNTAIIVITKEELQQFNVNTGDTEGIEREDVVKLSLRSIGDFPANEICKKYFSGGGHKNASGGISSEKIDAVREKFNVILPEYQSLLVK